MTNDYNDNSSINVNKNIKYKILGHINNVPNYSKFEEKFEFYNAIEDVFSSMLSQLANDLNSSIEGRVTCNIKSELNDLIEKKEQLHVVCKIQEYQVNPMGQYRGKIHREGLYSDCVKMVLIYIIEQSPCLAPCTLKINHRYKWNGNQQKLDCEIVTQENMAIVFDNGCQYNTTHELTIRHNNSETGQGTRKVLEFWILENRSKMFGGALKICDTYNSLDKDTGLNLRFDTHLIVNNWARKEFQKNYIVVIPRDLSLLITTYACGDLEYILNQRKEFRDTRYQREVSPFISRYRPH